MKKFALILIPILLIFAGCKHGMHSGLKGSGKREVQKRQISPFTSISTEGAFTIEVVSQQTQALEVEGDDNILPLIITEVANGELRLRSTQNFSVSEPVSFKISVPNLEKLTVSGAGKIQVSDLKNEKFEIVSEGAPQINVSGSTKTINIDTSGAAKIDTHSLRAAKGVVESKGVSSIEVDVNDHLDITISGPSTVTYHGDPSINKTISGPGRLIQKQSEGAWQIQMAAFEGRT